MHEEVDGLVNVVVVVEAERPDVNRVGVVRVSLENVAGNDYDIMNASHW